MKRKSEMLSFGYKARDIAKYIILHEDEQGYALNNLKLQKILYFLQAEYTVRFNQTLFDDEIIAWPCGPVIESVYYEYNRCGSAAIFINSKKMPYIAPSDRKIINAMLDKLRPYSATSLCKITVNQAPWKVAYARYDNVIYPYSLREYFKE